MRHKVIFSGVNSEISFSLIGYLSKVKEHRLPNYFYLARDAGKRWIYAAFFHGRSVSKPINELNFPFTLEWEEDIYSLPFTISFLRLLLFRE